MTAAARNSFFTQPMAPLSLTHSFSSQSVPLVVSQIIANTLGLFVFTDDAAEVALHALLVITRPL